jgi:hypothetical protein
MSEENVELVRQIYREGLIDGDPKRSEIQEEAHTWTLRDRKVARFERGLNLEAALEAAGLSE